MEERILRTEYSDLMQKSYIDYAMSVIVARALPDVRDGLKPVQRRTLYDMHELGIKWDKPYRKSARIVGDTMGKYHPHGDSSIYEALVVMAQDFKKGLPLVDGHGNFGTIEGDGAAASRYTEARLSRITQEAFLADLDKDVVDFVPNYDENETEPSVLPVKIPNLLINGAEGIAVGMATSIPPHNLSEIIDATKAYMKDENISTRALMKYVKGPDFPTGGMVCNQDELLDIYETGAGKIRIRGRIEEEKVKGGKTNIVITEIPYTMIGAGISKFLQDVAALAESKKTADILDISNQSSKEGIRIVIELRKDADVEGFKNLLLKKTKLEDTFGVNMLAIADGKPETMGLKAILKHCVDFQYEVNTRKYTNLLEKEQKKKEIQEGLIKACNVIDLIIEILRGSKDRAMAKACLCQGITDGINFKYKESAIMASQLMFSEPQADAILEMRLYKLIGLELEALIKEHEQTMQNIYKYEDILARKDSMAQVIIQELDQIKKAFSRPRRTIIDNAEEIVLAPVKVEEVDVFFLMDRFGYCKLIDEGAYERNKDAVLNDYKYIVKAKNTGKICVFTDNGNLHTVRIDKLPISKVKDKGVPIDNISNYDSSKENIVCITCQSMLNLYRMLFVTELGLAKMVDGGEFDVSKKTVAGTTLNDGDKLVSVYPLTDNRNIVLQTKDGFFLKFSAEEIPMKKKGAAGVRAIKLSGQDRIENVYYVKNAEKQEIEYRGKAIELNALKLQNRDGKGVKVRT